MVMEKIQLKKRKKENDKYTFFKVIQIPQILSFPFQIKRLFSFFEIFSIIGVCVSSQGINHVTQMSP